MLERARAWPSAWSVLRVRQWLVFAPLPAAGIARVSDVGPSRFGAVLAAAAVSGFALAYAYGINAIVDRHTDRDPGKNVLAGHDEVPPTVTASVATCGLAALAGAAAIGLHALEAIAISIAAGTVYSAGPRLKRFPLVGLLANVFIFAPLMFTALPAGGLPAGMRTLVPAFVVLLAQNQLLHEEADAAEDEQAGALMTAPWLGRAGARWALVALAASLVAVGVVARSTAAAAVAVMGAAATLWVSLGARPAPVRRKAHRYVAAAVGAALFLVLLDR